MASTARIDPALRIDSVRLAVADLDRSTSFYKNVLGLPLLSRDSTRASFGTDPDRLALELLALPHPTPLSPHDTGLFHVAWLHPSRAALADTVRRVADARWRIDGASDHGVSEALYLSDPDGLGIEIYADRPEAEWQRTPDSAGVQMGTTPLDLDDLLAQAPSEPAVFIAPGTRIGHVHLKVSDVSRALAFYRDVVGMDEQARLPSAAFVSAGGYHHHIGLNSWQSAGASPSPDTAPGLRQIEFALSDQGELDALRSRVADAAVRDPDGIQLSFMLEPLPAPT